MFFYLKSACKIAPLKPAPMYKKLSLKIRVMILAALTVLFVFTLAMTNVENLLGCIIGGVIAGLLFTEYNLYVQRRAE